MFLGLKLKLLMVNILTLLLAKQVVLHLASTFPWMCLITDKMKDNIDLLIDLLNDPEAREDERDDAALDLGDFDDERVLLALLQFVSTPKEEYDLVVQSCLDSIAQIMTRSDSFDLNVYEKLSEWNKRYVGRYIRNVKPQWTHLVEV